MWGGGRWVGRHQALYSNVSGAIGPVKAVLYGRSLLRSKGSFIAQVDEEVAHGLAGIRRLVQTLQDQVDSSGSGTAPSPDDQSSSPSSSNPSARKFSSNAQPFALDSIQRVSREVVAAKAAWALANLAANNKDNQDAVR